MSKIKMSKVVLGFIGMILLSCNSSQSQEQNISSQTQADSVTVGAEVLMKNHLDELEGKRVGLVMNPTARVEGTHMLDTLLAREVNIVALFAPEHGFRGEAGAGEVIKNGKDQATGLPVYSLYSDTRKPTPEMLDSVDVLIYDMQDVGARFYTYNTTLGLVLEAAAESDIPVWVLDRPNPAGGNYVAGWTLDMQYKSFVGKYPIPMAHGLTLGELAKMMIGEGWLQTDVEPDLRVISMKGWERSMKWPQTGLKWHAPSPNLPTFEHAFTYLGTVLFEASNLSEGRGTPDPFLIMGAPQTQISAAKLDKLRDQFEGVQIKKTTFTPESIPGKSVNPRYEGTQCQGVKVTVTNFDTFDPVAFGVKLFELILESTEGSKTTDYIYKLAGSEEVDSYTTDWNTSVEQFKNDRKPYLIYE